MYKSINAAGRSENAKEEQVPQAVVEQGDNPYGEYDKLLEKFHNA